MPNLHEGRLDAKGKRVAIVASRFNDFVTHRLVDGAIDCLTRNGADESSLDIYWVPGSFEVPQLAHKLSQTTKFDGILCLGTIIRGDTYHFDVLSGSVFRSIADLASRSQIPVTHGLITADSPDQAMDRAGGKGGNKGWDGAQALIEMMNLWKS